MEILGELDRKDWIAIFGVLLPAIITISLFFISHLMEKMGLRQVSLGPVAEWKKQSLRTRIFLHRVAAIVTLFVVLYLIREGKSESMFIWYGLYGMVALEVIWTFRYLKFNWRRSESRDNGGWTYIVRRFIEDKIILKYKRTEYPVTSLFVEGIALTYLCIVSGGISSPFMTLFIYFCVLTLYVSFSCKFRHSAAYILVLYSFFLFIFYLGDMQGSVFGHGFTIPASYGLNVTLNETYVFSALFLYSTAMCGILFLGIMEHSAKLAEDWGELAVKQTIDILRANKKNIDYNMSEKSRRVFLIGDGDTFDVEKTLALLPYCSRGQWCPIRSENTKKAINTPINGEGCQHCGKQCPIGKVFSYEVNGKHIARIKVIGTSHNIDNAVNEFCLSHELRHVISVCCTSNLAKYLPRYKGNEAYKNVTVIYTPLLVGTEACLSSIDPDQHERASGQLPHTWFDVEGLIDSLNQMVKAGKELKKEG